MCFNLQIYTFFRIPATFNFFFKFCTPFHPLFFTLFHPFSALLSTSSPAPFSPPFPTPFPPSFHPLFLPLIHPLFHPFVRRDKVVNDGNILNPFWFSTDSVLTKY